jgi:hypothetical protein
VSVYLDDFLDGGCFEEGGCDAFLNAQDDAVSGGYLVLRDS